MPVDIRKLVYRPSNREALQAKAPVEQKTRLPYVSKEPPKLPAKSDLVHLFRRIETPEHLREVKRILEFIKSEKIFQVSSTLTKQLTRKAAIAGLYPEFSAIIAIHSKLSNIYDVEGSREFFRAWITRFDVLQK